MADERFSRNQVEADADDGLPTRAYGGVRIDIAKVSTPGMIGAWIGGSLQQAPSWLVSMIVHTIVLLVMGMWVIDEGTSGELSQLLVNPKNTEEFDDLEELYEEQPEDIEMTTEVVEVETRVEPEMVTNSPADDMEAAAIQIDLSDFGIEKAPRNDLLAMVGAYSGSGLSGRGSGNRGSLVRKYGGNDASERAVAAALKWLAAHQLADGGWSFDHTRAPSCQGVCGNPGSLGDARNAATGMALLPFLGAGQTHVEGKYQSTVKAGLYYLVSHIQLKPEGGSLYEGGGAMYAHGIASIALCEAYGMTQDKALYNPAQAALQFVCYAQDPVGGGWRYAPRQKGDTSVVGWQIMALKSGHMAYLRIPPIVVKKASDYLDSVQTNEGANYGYASPGAGQATSSIGLLCRMYLGWKKDNPGLQRGIQWLGKQGPSKGNMYYNYYATQVMRHWEGEEWDKWNKVMRDQLVGSQDQNGHQKGSWYVAGGDHGAGSGGRVYCTAMAAMILEVYYRHLPIYRKQSTQEDFPED